MKRRKNERGLRLIHSFIHSSVCVCASIPRFYVVFIIVSLKNLHKCRAVFCAVGNARSRCHSAFIYLVFVSSLLCRLSLSPLYFTVRSALRPRYAICCLHICEARSQINWVVWMWRRRCGQANKPSTQVRKILYILCVAVYTRIGNTSINVYIQKLK